jgi:hypothetical protein
MLQTFGDGGNMTGKLQPAVTALYLLRTGCAKSKPLTKTTFDADVAPAFAHLMSPSELRVAYETARTTLRAAGLVSPRPRSRAALDQTPEGREKASALIDVETWPADATWKKFIVPRLVGPLVGKTTAQGFKEILSADGLRRAILVAAQRKIPKAKKLSEKAKDEAASAVGSRSRDYDDLLKTMLRSAATAIADRPPRWLLGAKGPTSQSLSLTAFAAAVKKTAKEAKTGRIGSLVFISHVYDTMQKRYPEWKMSLDEFKARLKEAALANLVDLAVANVMEREWLPDLHRSRIDDGVRRWDVVKIAA